MKTLNRARLIHKSRAFATDESEEKLLSAPSVIAMILCDVYQCWVQVSTYLDARQQFRDIIRSMLRDRSNANTKATYAYQLDARSMTKKCLSFALYDASRVRKAQFEARNGRNSVRAFFSWTRLQTLFRLLFGILVCAIRC